MPLFRATKNRIFLAVVALILGTSIWKLGVLAYVDITGPAGWVAGIIKLIGDDTLTVLFWGGLACIPAALIMGWWDLRQEDKLWWAQFRPKGMRAP